MSRQFVNIGTVANDGTGEPIRSALDKLNDNFIEVYTALGGDTLTTIINNGELDLTGSNKITFLFNDTLDLPAASSYHGMFAHVHTQGAAYFAHAGNWVELANKSDLSNINIGDLVDVDTTTTAPTNGQVLKWSSANSAWEPANDTGPSALTDLGISDGTNGQVLTTDGAGNFSFTTVTSGTSYTNSDVDTHLNTSTAGTNQLLSWDGSDYAWVTDQTGSGGTSYNQSLDTTDDVTFNTLTVDSLYITGTGLTDINSTTDINLNATNRVAVGNTTPFRVANFTTAQRDALTALNGDTVYNTDTNKFQGYANGVWVDLH